MYEKIKLFEIWSYVSFKLVIFNLNFEFLSDGEF